MEASPQAKKTQVNADGILESTVKIMGLPKSLGSYFTGSWYDLRYEHSLLNCDSSWLKVVFLVLFEDQRLALTHSPLAKPEIEKDD